MTSELFEPERVVVRAAGEELVCAASG